MSKLLKESQIRRFMKLASLGTLSDGFVNEGSYGEYKRDEDYMGEEEIVAEEDELEMGAEEDEIEMGSEEDELEMGAEEDEIDAEGGDKAEAAVVDIVSTITNALAAEYDLDIDVESDEGGDEAMDDAPAEEEAEPDLGGEEELGDLEVVDDEEEEEMIAEVLSGVTARLKKTIKENKKTRIARRK